MVESGIKRAGSEIKGVGSGNKGVGSGINYTKKRNMRNSAGLGPANHVHFREVSILQGCLSLEKELTVILLCLPGKTGFTGKQGFSQKSVPASWTPTL